MSKGNNSRIIFIALIIVLSVYALHPLFNKYIFSGHDMISHIERCIELKYALSHGILYPRIFTHLCFGYSAPILNYQSPLFYYAVDCVDFFVDKITTSIKFVLGLCIILSGIFMYQLVSYLWNDKAGVIAGLMYIYTPYHISQIYVRASMTEFFAVTLFPLLTYQSLRYAEDKTPKRFFFLSLLTSFLFLSHNPMALIFPPLLAGIFLYKAFLEKKYMQLWDLSKPFITGILLSMFFLAPAVLEKGYISLSKLSSGVTDFHQHFVYFYQFFSPFWGYEWSLKGPIDGMGFQIGLINTLAVIFAFFVFHKFGNRDKAILIFILLAFFISIFLMMRQSEGFWELIPYLQYMWLPWRFLAISGFLTSILGGFVYSKLLSEGGENRDLLHIFFMSVLIILCSMPILNKRDFNSITDVPQTTGDIEVKGTTTSYQDEYLPIWVIKKPKNQPSSKIEPMNLTIGIFDFSSKPLHYKFRCKNFGERGLIRINTFYFPGWKAYTDGEESEILYDGVYNGIMHLEIEGGEHFIDVKYEGTTCQSIGWWISILTFTVILFRTILSTRKRRN